MIEELPVPLMEAAEEHFRDLEGESGIEDSASNPFHHATFFTLTRHLAASLHLSQHGANDGS
jgi:hypothetical protein